MSLIQCPECGANISDSAPKCPHCGYPLQSRQSQKPNNKKWVWIALSVIAIVAIGAGAWFLTKGVGIADDTDAIVEITPEFIEKVQQYDKLAPFSEGRAAVCRGELWGYINTKGEEVIPCQFSRAEVFHDGLTQVVKDDAVYYLNRKGDKVFDGEGGRFSEGLALLTDGRVVDTNGNEKFKVNVYTMAYTMSRDPNATTYTDFPYFENGVIAIFDMTDEDLANGRYDNVTEHCYDTTGKLLSKTDAPEHKSSYQTFSEEIDYDKEFNDGHHTGLKDVNGNIVIPAKYTEVSDISNGVALVTLRENDAYFANKNGYDSGWTDGFLEEYAPRYYGYSDSQGNTTFSKETLQHIEEADQIGREQWFNERERQRQEEKKKREEGERITITFTVQNNSNGDIVNLTGNYRVGVGGNSYPIIITDKIRVPDGKVWVWEGVELDNNAFYFGAKVDIYDGNNPSRRINYYERLRGWASSPLPKRMAIDSGNYIVVYSDFTSNCKAGSHTLTAHLKELDREYYREKCGYNF